MTSREDFRGSVDGLKQRKSSLSPPQVVSETKQVIKRQAVRVANQAHEHETLLNKITYLLGVLGFGTFCFLLGSRPQDIPFLYCLFFIVVAPLRWIYYRFKKWHYYLLDFCYYANAIFITMLLFYPNNERLFMVCFSFSEGPLAWALIVWRCSLVFNSFDKIVSVLIHLLPGTVFFIIRWWDPTTFSHHSNEVVGPWPAWPVVNNQAAQWVWLFSVPLLVYCIWQALYFLIVEGLRRQRLLRDPEVMTSYRELKRKAERANNIWWRLSGMMGAEKRVYMYAIIQAIFTVATLAFTVPLFQSYWLHTWFEIFKLSATVWNGGNYIFEVMPRQAVAKKMKKTTNRSASDEYGRSNGGPSDVKETKTSFSEKANALQKEPICTHCRKASVEDVTESLPVLEG
ncbi:hypothetical protein KP509_27G003300 [Ceratopteris richardii]|uniref:Glycerophosphocholine acyltransferase 1 n=1 Tax=Ceratopteris richardii TaxID=49495 RepID=A0A8T2RG11_CERRI|nr:hypothetical protein KP509_27G003300 [Ceratopteris richardii]